MADINALIDMMRQLEDQLVVCMRCGMCQAVCPLYAQTGREADVARGKLALLDGLLHEMFKDPQGASQRLSKCLLCGSCEANCPSGVSVMDIFLKARAILAGYMGLPPAKRLILRGLLGHPERFDQMSSWGAKFQKIFTRPANAVLGTSCARFASPLLGDRHFRHLADPPFHRSVPALDTRGGRSGLRTAFFVGCLIDKLYPQIAQASLTALGHHGVDVFLPENQACCGIPAISSGDLDTFTKLVRHNVELFARQKFDYLITACATCTSTIKKVWPQMVPASADFHAQVLRLAAKTMDIHQFLVKKAGQVASPRPAATARRSVTYHDPCHLKKSLGVWAEPRRLIQANADYALREMPGSDQCCGMGGSFNLQYYEISSNIGRLKLESITASGCSTVATGCPACMLQISDMISRSGQPIDVKHAMEIYAESLEAK
jgi:glycolate oxidase iron-sulfur subunit